MNKYAGTQSEKNLMTAFAGESEARNKYPFFASVAKKQGFEQIAALFLKTEKPKAFICRESKGLQLPQGITLKLRFARL